MSIYCNGVTGRSFSHGDPVPLEGEVQRNGVILKAHGPTDTPEDREARIRALAARIDRGERLFEAGALPVWSANGYTVI